jgi:ferric iron reductase protein FhuF
VDAADFFGSHLDSVIDAHASARATVDRRVAASVLFQGYVRRVAEPLVDALLHNRPPPDPGMDAVVVHLAEGWITDVTLGTVASPPHEGDPAAWEWAHRRLVDDNLAVAVAAVRRAVRLSRRTLWGNAAAAIAGAFRTATAADPDLDPAAVATRLECFLARDRRTYGLCVPYLVDHAERSWLVHERRTCCLLYTVPGHSHCASCSLLDSVQRRARTVDALPNAVRAT